MGFSNQLSASEILSMFTNAGDLDGGEALSTSEDISGGNALTTVFEVTYDGGTASG